MQYLIIGGGVASVAAIEGIRRQDKGGAITLVTAEPVKTYGRPLISYYLAGKIGKDKIAYRPEKFWKDNKVELVLGTTVTSLDTKAKKAALSDGSVLSYDACLLATGGKPFAPAVEGSDGPDVYRFTTLADAEALMARLDEQGRPVRRAAIVGAGLIALKAAEGLAARGVEVTLVVRSRIMRAYFDEPAGELLVRHLEKKGVKFLNGQTPQAILRGKDGRVKAVRTDKGQQEADLVILAAGVRPNLDLAKSAGIECGKGVLVNDRLMTSAKDVYAAGDVAEAVDLITGERRVIPIWPNAYNQGFYAGRNMAGADVDY
ncbi:MAG: NAD(P)/FAD-dependent oxidoreductase, partial [Desulfovibrionaceae bacterium]